MDVRERPGHFLMLTPWRLAVLLALGILLVGAALATFRRCHIDSVLAVGSHNSMKSHQINAGFGHQCGQLRYKVQRFGFLLLSNIFPR